MDKIKQNRIFWIDLFCGAGGTSTGIHMADANAKVVACVNHDAVAILSHKENHPDCLHFTEDVRDFKVVEHLKRLVDKLRLDHPGCIINLWASLECTNYSKAKGGLPRDADSRTLAHALFMYIEQLNPDYIYIENVREFMAWGPLDENGRPISRRNGSDYVKWTNKVQSFGYQYDFRLLNAADYGAYTSRLRYFGQFAKKGCKINWPKATHSKKKVENEGMFSDNKKPWKPVKEVLDLDDEGNSIFERKKELSENTLKRIYAGLIKFVANGQENFTKVYNSGNDMQRVKSIDEPIGSLTTANSHALVNTFMTQFGGGDPKSKVWGVEGPNRTVTSFTHSKIKTVFIQQRNSGNPKSKIVSIDGPARTITKSGGNQEIVKSVFLSTYYGNGAVTSINKSCPTITTKDRVSKIHPTFLVNNYSNGGEHTKIEGPAPTITSIPKSNLATCNFIDQQYGQSKPASIDEPANTVTSNPKLNLVSSKWLMDHQYSNKGKSIEESAPTIIARQDKKPLYFMHCDQSEGFGILVFENDCETMVKIKKFMALYGIIDIKMRMLKVNELLKIQGFPEDYKLKGTKTNQKKFIGNSVVPIMAQKLIEANCQAITEHLQKTA